MEDRVFSTFEEEKDILVKNILDKLGNKLDKADMDVIVDSVRNMVTNMIRLMREGKSAHEKFFSDIILNSIDAIIGLDTTFRIFLWNKGAEMLFGYKKEEVTGKDFSMLIPDYKLREGEKDFLITEVHEKGFLTNYESDRITKSGDIVHVSITRFEIHDEKDVPIGSVGIVRDVTQVKQLEKELREKENLALIGEVVSSIAHSLSNPLNIISGNADYLLLDKKPGEDGYDELKTIIDEASRITKSIRHLLNFSRPVKLNRQANDLNKVINDILSNIKYLTGSKKITIKKNLQKDLPEFKFDKDQIHEAVSNLITNAIQAIANEGEIKIKTQLSGNNVLITVCDNGYGISRDNIENVFKPFFSSKDYGKGTGLGLSITKRIVRNHSGDITVSSAPSKGTAFTIILPVK